MSDPNQRTGWVSHVAAVRPVLEEQHRTREQALQLSRKLIQTSATCIRHAHRRQFEPAAKLLEEAKQIARQAREAMCPHPSLLYAGYLQDAEKEMVEAAAVLAIVCRTPYPSPSDLGVDVSSYINGMAEAASECRRYVLDEMRAGRMQESERMLEEMEAIYDELITLDFPDALTGGLRRTCDALRAVVERTRSDLTTTSIQRELLEELRQARGGSAPSGQQKEKPHPGPG